MAALRVTLVRVTPWPEDEDPLGCWLTVLVLVAVIVVGSWVLGTWIGGVLYDPLLK